MRDYKAFRHSAIRYWERRRIFYNLALVLPALIGYAVADITNWVGDPHKTHYSFILPWFAVSALGANVCYSFGYALEFLFGNDDPKTNWLKHGRSVTFTIGVLFAMLLALIGGVNIASMEWNYGIRHGDR